MTFCLFFRLTWEPQALEPKQVGLMYLKDLLQRWERSVFTLTTALHPNAVWSVTLHLHEGVKKNKLAPHWIIHFPSKHMIYGLAEWHMTKYLVNSLQVEGVWLVCSCFFLYCEGLKGQRQWVSQTGWTVLLYLLLTPLSITDVPAHSPSPATCSFTATLHQIAPASPWRSILHQHLLLPNCFVSYFPDFFYFFILCPVSFHLSYSSTPIFFFLSWSPFISLICYISWSVSSFVTACQWHLSSSLWQEYVIINVLVGVTLAALYLPHTHTSKWLSSFKKKTEWRQKQQCYSWCTCKSFLVPSCWISVVYWLTVNGKPEVTLVRSNERSGLFEK